jgi:hypothetical protein
MASFKMKPVDQSALAQMLTESSPRGRTSRGGELVDEFIASGNTAVTVQLPSTKERNAIAISATNYARNNDIPLWVKKQGGGTGTDLLLINLSKANAETKRAYENRPRVGRRPAKR